MPLGSYTDTVPRYRVLVLRYSMYKNPIFIRLKRLLKSSSWPSTSYLGHLPLFVVPQRMLLKLRRDNSNFLPVFCGDFKKYLPQLCIVPVHNYNLKVRKC